MKYYELKNGEYPDKKENLEKQNEFFGEGWSVNFKDGKYILEYISGDHQGKLKEVDISQEDYDLLIKGETDINKICIKYNIY